jgi:hypothetical protein
LCTLAPNAIADAGLESAGPALPLLGRRARNSLRFQAAHTSSRIKNGAANQTRVNNDADALNRQARLGDVGCQHYLALTVSGRSKRGLLIVT